MRRQATRLDAAERLRHALETYLRVLVHRPDEVVVKAQEGDWTLILTVEVNEQDIGRVVGNAGTTVDAIRVLWGKAASRAGTWQRFCLRLPQTEATGPQPVRDL